MRFCWHSWGKWRLQNVRLWSHGKIVAYDTVQIRNCEKCGKQQEKPT